MLVQAAYQSFRGDAMIVFLTLWCIVFPEALLCYMICRKVLPGFADQGDQRNVFA